MFTILKIKETEYSLRLRARDVVLAEDRLGKSLIDVMYAIAEATERGGMSMLKFSEVAAILHASLQQAHHGITYDKALDLIDDIGLMEVVQPILSVITRDVLKVKEEVIEQAQEEVKVVGKSKKKKTATEV